MTNKEKRDKKTNIQYVCPTCKKQQTWQTTNIWRPFCCQRCKEADLSNWASNAYVITSTDEVDLTNNTENR